MFCLKIDAEKRKRKDSNMVGMISKLQKMLLYTQSNKERRKNKS